MTDLTPGKEPSPKSGESKDLWRMRILKEAAHADARGHAQLAKWYRVWANTGKKDNKPAKPYKAVPIPKTKLFLICSMGNSGGSWFELVCKSNPKVGAWEELIREIVPFGSAGWLETKKWNTKDRLRMAEKKYELFRGYETSGKWDSVGVIKSFAPYIKAYCEVRETKMMWMFRNPIKVVSNKFSKKSNDTKKWMKENWNEELNLNDKRRWFEGHVAMYAALYQKHLDDSSGELLVRLEDLSDSLRGDKPYFKKTMEEITQIEWDVSSIKRARKIKPYKERNKDNHFRDKSKNAYWLRWEPWQMQIFTKYFNYIMKDQGYEY